MKKLFLIIGVASLLSACSSSSQLTLTHSRYGNGWGLSMGEGGLSKAEEEKADAFRAEMQEKHAFKKSLRNMQSNKRGLHMLAVESFDIQDSKIEMMDEISTNAVSNKTLKGKTTDKINVQGTDNSSEAMTTDELKQNSVNQIGNETNKKPMSESDVALLLLIIIALILPPLAVFLYEGTLNIRFWICLLLTIFGFWILGIIYALIVILGNY